jgi:hypothetical protein
MRPRISRRHRRTLIAASASLAVLALIALGAFHRSTAAPYDPSAPAEGITSALARRVPDDYPRVQFVDAAADAGIRFKHFAGTRSTQLPEDMGSGAAWGDFDNDGDDDLFIVNLSGPLDWTAEAQRASPAASQLYRNDGGHFTEIGRQAGVDVRGCGMGAAWGDADGDGWLDLVVTACDRIRLFGNRRDGTFADRSRESGLATWKGFWAGASWGDYDRDGDLDLYICGYVRYTGTPHGAAQSSKHFDAEVPFTLNPSAYPPERNLLLRNDGHGRFVEVGLEAGVDDPGGRSLSAAWCDFDGDGWLDLYVANDVSDNAMYRNLGEGVFEDVSHTAWVADPRGAMGLAVGDWDGDGDFDIFVTHWLAQENALFSNMRLPSQGTAPGRLTFMDVADRQGLGQASLDYIKWGTAFFDYDNDGRPDLLSINGSTFQDPADPRRLIAMPHQLFWNRGPREGFFDVGAVSGAVFTEKTVGRGAAVADYDRDGDLDILVVNHDGPARLLRNDGGNTKGWLAVRARGARDRSGYGALVTITTGDVVQRQQIGAQSSYLSQHSAAAHFGLGGRTVVDEVVVRFLSGREVRRRGVAANQAITIDEETP